MWDLLIEGFVSYVLRWMVLILLTPIVLFLATPVIPIRAHLLASRGEQRFKFAVQDGYSAKWDRLCTTVTWRL
jgi:hypothetical protein